MIKQRHVFTCLLLLVVGGLFLTLFYTVKNDFQKQCVKLEMKPDGFSCIDAAGKRYKVVEERILKVVPE